MTFQPGLTRARQAAADICKRCLEAPELRRHQDEPRQMPSGITGKNGYLRLEFTRSGAKSVLSFMDRRVPYFVQKALYFDEQMPHMPCTLVNTTTGCLLQGDRMVMEIHVGRNACAHVSTTAATKVHMMNANFAAQTQDIAVESGGYLEFMPDTLILYRSARFFSRPRNSKASDAPLFCSELLLPGRKYHHKDELFGFDLYSSGIEIFCRESGKRLFSERSLIEPSSVHRERAGMMNGYEVIGNALLLAPPDTSEELARVLGAGIDTTSRLAFGASLLPGNCGVSFRVLGMTSEAVREKLRECWQQARRVATGFSIPAPFLWR